MVLVCAPRIRVEKELSFCFVFFSTLQVIQGGPLQPLHAPVSQDTLSPHIVSRVTLMIRPAFLGHFSNETDYTTSVMAGGMARPCAEEPTTCTK